MTTANTLAQTMFTFTSPLNEGPMSTHPKTVPKNGKMLGLDGHIWNVPHPNPKPTDDGFILVSRGAKKHSTTTAKTIAVTRTYSTLPSGKPDVTIQHGTGKAYKKNMKRKAKKAQSA